MCIRLSVILLVPPMCISVCMLGICLFLGAYNMKVLWVSVGLRMCPSQHIMTHCIHTQMAKAADEGLFFSEHIADIFSSRPNLFTQLFFCIM